MNAPVRRKLTFGGAIAIAFALVLSASAPGAVKIESSSTDAENDVVLLAPIKAGRFPKLTVSWIFAPEFDQFANVLEPSVLFCDVQLFRNDNFVNGVDVTFDIDLIFGEEIVQSTRVKDTTSSFAQASFQLNREDIVVTEISHAQVTSTLKGRKRVDEVSLQCTSRSKP